MKFSILSHAGLYVEHNGVSVVCDPWLLGSCYWRSWWNFPEPDPALIKDIAPTYIYLTHLHWDHFHGPSLKALFDPATKVIVPRVPTCRMIDDLRWLGFHNITELPHGGRLELGKDLTLWSYQFGLAVDSTAVISGGGFTLCNLNDCKFFGLPLRQILRDHPRIDFAFRSHSSASPIPFCVEDHQRLLPAGSASYDSADQFARCTLYVRARYAIPFASNHCFLHAETVDFNSTATTPALAKECFDKLAPKIGATTECVVMPPGSSWSDDRGFDIVHFDFSRRQQYVEMLLERHAPKLKHQYEMEAQAVGDFESFSSYFRRLLDATPWILRRWGMRPVMFRVKDSLGTHHWLVEPAERRVSRCEGASEDVLVFEVHATVVNDCTKLKMFSVWSASKRLRIHLPSAGALRDVNVWLTIVDLFEVDVLPLRRNFGRRALCIRLRRWREPMELAKILWKRLFFGERFSVSRIYPLKME